MSYKNVIMMLSNVAYWINIPLETTAISKTSYDEYSDYEESDLIVVWETAVQPLTDLQRLIFLAITIVIIVVAGTGNILVLYVNFSRKQRFLFRACLISLAMSDLIFVVVTSCIYLPKFLKSQSALWALGPLTCALLPFLQTMVVLVNSILLVCIALDRYMAVVRIVKGSWEPGKVFCLSCCVLIWGFAAGVSSPMLTIYDYYRVYVVPLPDPNEIDPHLTYYVGYLCGSDKDENGYFFAMIFSFIFVPLLVTFLWLNTVVAREVWKRRISVTVSVSENDTSSTAATLETGWRVQDYVTPETVARRAERKQRQVRMFKVILVLMSVFFLCRLPNWVFILYKLSNETQKNIHWVINYGVGLMVMVNCMLNPFLYTFLSETIRLTTFLAGIICGVFNPCVKLCKCKSGNGKTQEEGFGKRQTINNM